MVCMILPILKMLARPLGTSTFNRVGGRMLMLMLRTITIFAVHSRIDTCAAALAPHVRRTSGLPACRP